MADLVRAVDSLMANVYAAMWAMLAAGFVVAAFGVVNTLTMNVLEQTRELGLSRVVGMTRGQVRSYVISQAALIALVGLLPGARRRAGGLDHQPRDRSVVGPPHRVLPPGRKSSSAALSSGW